MRLAKSTLAVHSSRVHARVCGVCLRRLFGVTPFKMFSLTLHFDNSTILTRSSFSFYTSLHLYLLVEQEIVLSTVVGHLLLGLDTNVRIPRKRPLFYFGDSRFSVFARFCFFPSCLAEFREQPPEIPCKNKHHNGSALRHCRKLTSPPSEVCDKA